MVAVARKVRRGPARRNHKNCGRDGGDRPRVVKPDLFPWHAVLDLLMETGQDVWITKKDGNIIINTEPKVE